MKISEIITDKYKLRMPPTVYYELLADVQEVEEEQEPTDNDVVLTYDMYHELIADRAEKLAQEPILDKIRAEIEMEKLEDSPNFCIKAHNNAVDRVLQIIDKYKADTEVDNENDD